MVHSVISPVSASATPDVTAWTSEVSAGDNMWADITFGNGIFVAVAIDGDGSRVMTSPDGITWTLRTPAALLRWKSITFGGGQFVAVKSSGVGKSVMTSPDGITWTLQSNSPETDWWSITYGGGLFVAVAPSGDRNRVMTSPDGVTWTGRAAPLVQRGSPVSAQQGSWRGVAYGNGLFVAVSDEDEVMTSPDGETWTVKRDGINDDSWEDIVFGNGLFVAVSQGGNAMKSSNTVVWEVSATSSGYSTSISYGDGYFVGVTQDVASDGLGGFLSQSDQIFTSTNGLNWTRIASPIGRSWSAVTFGAGRFVAVASDGIGNRVMRSGVVAVTPPASDPDPPAPDPDPPAPDPAAIEAARLAEELAAIAEAARLRQIEIDNYRTALFAKLVRGERPTVTEYNNAVFYQIIDRIVETVTDQILQLEPSKRSNVATINSIADGAAFYDAFFNPLFPATVATYTRFGYTGVTERTLVKVNAKVQELPLVKRTGTTSIQEIATIENFIDRVANPATRSTVSAKTLITNGLLPADSPYKYSVIKGLSSYPEGSLNTMEKIEAAIKEQIYKAEAPKRRLAEIKAKIAARNK